MGRTLLALVVIAALAAGGWSLFRSAPAAPGAGAEGGETGDSAPAGPSNALAASPRPSVPVAPPPEAVAMRAMVGEGKAREAVARARAIPVAALREPSTAAAALDAARALASSSGAGPADRTQRADESRRLFGALFVSGAAPWSAVEKDLEALNREVLFCGREIPGATFRWTVKPGDTLDRLVRRDWKGRVRVGTGLILHLNNVSSPDRLRPGPIYVPEEPVRILVRKKDYRLWVLLGEVPVRSFPVGLGMQGRTPEGLFTIEEMMPRPDYWPPGGKRVPFGHKDNPLGTRWMGFKDTPEARGFGIHGTDDPSSIGKDLSQGCVRLANPDVEALFGWICVGAEVEIAP